MAGDWIPYDKNLPNKLEVIRIATATGMSRREVVAALMEFWAWADGQTQDGFLPGITVTLLSHFCHTFVVTASRDGDTTAAQFFAAVAAVGWIREVVRNKVEGVDIVNFDYYMGESAKKRLHAARRQRKSRDNRTGRFGKTNAKRHTPVTKTCDESVTTGQDRTGHINTPPTPLSGGGDVVASEDENADLPPFVAGRRKVMQPCDVPQPVHAQGVKVARHYVAVVKPGMMVCVPGLVAVLDLLDSGVRPDMLTRAADAYAAFVKVEGCLPMGVLNFFGPGDNWKEYRRGPPKSKPVKAWEPPPPPEYTPEEVERARRALEAKRAGKEAARKNGTTATGGTVNGAKPPETHPGGLSVSP